MADEEIIAEEVSSADMPDFKPSQYDQLRGAVVRAATDTTGGGARIRVDGLSYARRRYLQKYAHSIAVVRGFGISTKEVGGYLYLKRRGA